MPLIKAFKSILYKAKKIKEVKRNGAVILLYHRVINLQSDPQQLAVSPEHFEKHIQLIKRKYDVLSFDELYYILSTKKKIPKKSILITFDDGYNDNFYHCKDILTNNKVPAVFFVSTSNLNTRTEFWWDSLERCILNNKKFPLVVDINIESSFKCSFSLNDNRDNAELYDRLIEDFRSVPPLERNLAIDQICFCVDNESGRQTHMSMNNEELIKFSNSSYITIGAHTHNHPSLAALDYEGQLYEIGKSKETLENILKKKINYFSYPFGSLRDYNNDTKAICRNLEFLLVAANYPGKVYKTTNTFELPRYLVRNWNEDEFSEKLDSFFL